MLIRPVLVGGDDKSVAKRLEKFPQAQFARHAAEHRPGLKSIDLGVGVV